MKLQYISDAQGRHTAVIITIAELNNLMEKHQDLKSLGKPKAKPSDFFVTLRQEAGEKMQEYVSQSRTE